MAKFVSVVRDGYTWLAFEWAGGSKRIMLHKMGKVGDCIRPGQKIHPDRDGQ